MVVSDGQPNRHGQLPVLHNRGQQTVAPPSTLGAVTWPCPAWWVHKGWYGCFSIVGGSAKSSIFDIFLPVLVRNLNHFFGSPIFQNPPCGWWFWWWGLIWLMGSWLNRAKHNHGPTRIGPMINGQLLGGTVRCCELHREPAATSNHWTRRDRTIRLLPMIHQISTLVGTSGMLS